MSKETASHDPNNVCVTCGKSFYAKPYNLKHGKHLNTINCIINGRTHKQVA